MGLLRQLGVKIDFSNGDVYVGNQVINSSHESDREFSHTGTNETGHLDCSLHSVRPKTLETGYANMWYVVAAKNESIPPMSEVLVRGRLSIHAPREGGLQPTRIIAKPNEVLIEPIETRIHGVRIARVLSRVMTTENGNTEVVLQLINYSKEPLEVPKNSLLGLAEELENKVLENSFPRNCVNKNNEVSCISRFKVSNEKLDYELNREIESKIEHLSSQDKKILQPVLFKYKHLFGEPELSGCKVNIRHKIDTGDNPPIRKIPYRLPHSLKPVVKEQIHDRVSYVNLIVLGEALWLLLLKRVWMRHPSIDSVYITEL